MVDETLAPNDEQGGDDDALERQIAAWLDRLLAGERIDPVDVLLAHPGTGHEILERLETFTRFGSDDTPALRHLGGFTLVRELGRGGMGVVYEAYQEAMDRRVALKILPPGVAADRTAFLRFLREAQTAGKLKDPAIVGVHALGVEEDTPYYAMEFIDGPTLAAVVAERRAGNRVDVEGPLGRAERDLESHTAIAKSFAEVAAGLHHAHREGVVHRDIKPSNVMVDRDGRLRILDFGLAYFEDLGTLTLTGETVGTPLYMSPEQARRERIAVDHRTDIYSLGATLYEALALEPPFRGKNRDDTLRQIVESDPPALRIHAPAVPEPLETIVLQCLRKDPDDRYASAEALAQDLRRFARGEPIEARPESRWGRMRRGVRRQRVPLAVASVFLVLVALSGTSFLRSERIAREKAEADYGPAVERLAATLTAGQFSLARSTTSRAADLGLPTGTLSPLSEDNLRELVRDGAMREVEAAVTKLEDLTRHLPDEPDGHYHLARGYRLLGDDARAVRSARKIAATFYPARVLLAELEGTAAPPPPEGHWSAKWGRARDAIRRTNVWKPRIAQEAAAAAGQVIAAASEATDFPRGFLLEAHLVRGVAHLASADREEDDVGDAIDEAMLDFAVARHLAPSSLEPELLLGKAYLLKDRPHTGAMHFDELHAAAAAERRDEIALWIALVHVAMDDHEGALAWSGRIANDFFRGRLLAYVSYRERDFAAAARAGRAALAERPQDLAALLLHGTVLTRLTENRGRRRTFQADSPDPRDALVVELARTVATALGLETGNRTARFLLRVAWEIANEQPGDAGNETMKATNAARLILLAAAGAAAVSLSTSDARGEEVCEDFTGGVDPFAGDTQLTWSNLPCCPGTLTPTPEGLHFESEPVLGTEEVFERPARVHAVILRGGTDANVNIYFAVDIGDYYWTGLRGNEFRLGRVGGGGTVFRPTVNDDFTSWNAVELELLVTDDGVEGRAWRVGEDPEDGVFLSRNDPGLSIGGVAVSISTGTLISVCVEEIDLVPPTPPRFLRGEVHGTEPEIDLSDGVAILNWLFLGGPEPGCLDAADANDSGEIDLTDAVHLFDHLFITGAPLPAPSGDASDGCGEDPTGDAPDGTGDLGCLRPPEYCGS